MHRIFSSLSSKSDASPAIDDCDDICRSIHDAGHDDRDQTTWSAEEKELHVKLCDMLDIDSSRTYCEREVTPIEHIHQIDTWDCGE